MRVLHLYSGNLYGGVETLLVTLARYRHLCPNMEPHYGLCFEGRLSEELRASEVAVHYLGNVRVRRPLSVLKSRSRLKDLLRREQFDIAVCHSAWSQAIFGPILRGEGLPLVFWLHDAIDGRHWLERWAQLTPPDVAICNSYFTKDSLQTLYPRVRSEVIYCPVALPEVRYRKSDRAVIRQDLGTSIDTTVVIQVSRMEPWKGHRLHLQALSRLTDLPNWVCWIVGGAQRSYESEYFRQLIDMASRLGLSERVRFLGQRLDVPRLLAAADIHCQPNLGPEPFGITFVEALLAWLPVITTDIGGAKEIVESSCGLLVQPKNEDALAKALRKVIASPVLRAELGSAGPARAAQLCQPVAQMKSLRSLLFKYLKQSKAAYELSAAKH